MKTSKDDSHEQINDHEALILITALDRTMNIWASDEGKANAQALMAKLMDFRIRTRGEQLTRKKQ